jgi:6-pyruvoyltetrahydropterin/6-carboxytetrahydropterin synthase
MYRIGKQFRFDAAHHLPDLPPGHQRGRMHGHTYTVEAVMEADQLVPPGFVVDFGCLAPLKKYIDSSLDHRVLNEVLPEPPTAELIARHLAQWVVGELEPRIPAQLAVMRVCETPSCWAEYVPERS